MCGEGREGASLLSRLELCERKMQNDECRMMNEENTTGNQLSFQADL
jgi:hypothetical protein